MVRFFRGGGEEEKAMPIETSTLSIFLLPFSFTEYSLQELALDLIDGLVAGRSLKGDGIDSQRHRRGREFFF